MMTVKLQTGLQQILRYGIKVVLVLPSCLVHVVTELM